MAELDDRYAAQRLGALSVLIEGEREVYREYLAAVDRWAGKVAPRVLAPREWGTLDAFAIRAGQGSWLRELGRFVLDVLGGLIEAAFVRVFGSSYRQGSYNTRPWVEQYLAGAVNRMAYTPEWLFNEVRAALDVGMSSNEGIGELADRIEASLFNAGAPVWEGRGRMVARTEAISAINGGTQEAFAVWAEVFDEPLEKVWLASIDTRTRDSHFAADGQRVPLHGTFTLSRIHKAQFPGDPLLPPEERINCRCSVLYVEPGEEVDMSNRGMRGEAAIEEEVARRRSRGIMRDRDR